MNIIFDLGGVVVRWEPDRIIASAIADPATRAQVRRDIIDHPDWLAMDRGTLLRDEAILRAALRTGLDESLIRTFMHSVPPALTLIHETVELMRQLRSLGHSLYCLSNMPFASLAHLEAAYDFWPLFSGRVISCHHQLCKPEAGIYITLLNTYSLDPMNTVFIDDVDANLQAAAQFGIRTLRFENPAQCRTGLQGLGCI